VNISDYAAWYAALIATFVFLWDIIKWKKSGPQIKATARSGYRSFGDPETEGKRLILVIATNIGDRATTLTAMGFRWYPKRYYLLLEVLVKFPQILSLAMNGLVASQRMANTLNFTRRDV